MRRLGAAFAALVLTLLMAAPALAQSDPDAGSGDAGLATDAGPLFVDHPGGLVASFADGGNLSTLDFAGQLQTGSELGAGVDPAAAGQIIHPSNLNTFAASLRTLGGFDKGSVVVQFNPYRVIRGYDKLYDEWIADRKNIGFRWLQDNAITLATASGNPYRGGGQGASGTSTAAVGATVEMLGNRGFFSDTYAKCMDAREADLYSAEGHHFPEGNDDQAAASQQQELAAKVGRAVQECTDAAQNELGLFLSGGGRWVITTPGASSATSAKIQRSYASATFDGSTTTGDSGFFGGLAFEVAAQARYMQERLAAEEAMNKLLDAGVSLGISGKRASFRLESVIPVDVFDGSALKTADASLRIKLSDQLYVTLEAKAEGTNPRAALQSITPSIAVIYAEKTVFQRTLKNGSP